MIVKGKARGAPAQLAAYVLHTTDGDPAVVLRLDYGNDDLKTAFIEWDSIGELTNGKHTLYHAQINPDPNHPMTDAEFLRAAEILAEELGMPDHPRAVIKHGGEKPHVHVVIMRTNMETLKLWDTDLNYAKHELASRRMEVEFNHPMVPGKHAKRDRAAQPEFPRSRVSHAQAQQEKRTGVKIEDRKAEITALHAGAADAAEFKTALEEVGYRLARGDRGFVVVDRGGGHSVLARNIEGFKKKDVDAYMTGIALDTLPTIAEAKQMQKRQPEPPTPAPPSPHIDASHHADEVKPQPMPDVEQHRHSEAWHALVIEATGGGNEDPREIEPKPPPDVEQAQPNYEQQARAQEIALNYRRARQALTAAWSAPSDQVRGQAQAITERPPDAFAHAPAETRPDPAEPQQRQQQAEHMHESVFASAKKFVTAHVLPKLRLSSVSFLPIQSALQEVYDKGIEHARELLPMFTRNNQTALATPHRVKPEGRLHPPPDKKREVLTYKKPDPDRSR